MTVDTYLLGLAACAQVLVVAGQLLLLGEVGEAVVERLLALQGEVQLVEVRRPAALLLALEALGHVGVLAPGGYAGSFTNGVQSEMHFSVGRLIYSDCTLSKHWKKVGPFLSCCAAYTQTNAGRHQLNNNGPLVLCSTA